MEHYHDLQPKIMDYESANKRAIELMEPINKSLMLCDDRTDLLILCFAMINRSKDVIDQVLGPERRNHIFSEYVK